MTAAGPGGGPGDAQILAGRYRLDERIGVGAMGEVWQARDLRLQRDVAVKRVRLDGHVDAAAQARFQREAVAMAGVSHPNVVSVYDAGTHSGDDQTAYLVMELLDGPSCADLIAAPRSISLGEVERIGAGVARGLAAAHSAGVVHRDIKPSNVVVSRGVPKIVDFGIARLEQEATSTLTAPQTAIGTAAYMSPEQALGKPVGPSSDVYSLGALLVALASGSPPFGAANSLAVMRAHVDDPPPSLASLRDDAPPSLVALVDRMLAKAPGDRPTAADVAHVLEGGTLSTEVMAAAGPRGQSPPGVTRIQPAATAVYAQPAPVPPVTPAEPTRRESTRRSSGALWWLVAAALLVVAFALGANALRDGEETVAAPGDSATTPTPTQSVVTQVVTPTREATTAPAAPPPPDEEADAGGGDLATAVAAVTGSIDAVADDEARDELIKLWQPASSGLQGSNAADKLREVQQEADDLFDDEQLTAAERDAISSGIENVIALL
ncbi:MAG: serine/threonine protein kinase [Intrasporangiaceae bacterium]|nr:serine/threonine protein kinase [Intrasporangiaceae bacterium]